MTAYCAACGQPVDQPSPTAADARDRVQRVRTVACTHCHAQPGKACVSPAGKVVAHAHASRWDAYYAAQRTKP